MGQVRGQKGPSWDVPTRRLEELADVRTGAQPKSSKSTKGEAEEQEARIRSLTPAALTEAGEIRPGVGDKISASQAKGVKRLIEGDILFVYRGDAPRSFLVRASHVQQSPLVASFSLMLIRPREESEVHPAFLHWFLSCASTRNLLTRLAVGATVARIRTQDLRQLEVPVPPLDRQRALGQVQTNYEAWLRGVEAERAAFEDWIGSASEAQLNEWRAIV